MDCCGCWTGWQKAEMAIRIKFLVLPVVHAQPLYAMRQSGFLEKIGEANVCGNIDDALNRARAILGLPPVERPVPFVPTVAREANKSSIEQS